MTQTEIWLRHLNDKKEWVFNYELLGRETKFGWLGSQADKRARELAPRQGDKKYFEYEGEYKQIRYMIKGRKIEGQRQYYVEILAEQLEPVRRIIETKQEQLFNTQVMDNY